MIKLLKSNNFDEDIKNTSKSNLSRILKKLKDDEKIRKCIKYGADIYYKDKLGRNVLFYNIHPIYLQRGVSPFEIDKYGQTCLFYIDNETDADRILKTIKIKWKEENIIDYLNHKDKNGKTALFHNNTYMKKWLIKHGADCDIYDNNFNRPIFFAKNVEETKLFIKNGVLESLINLNGEIPLFYVNDIHQLVYFVKHNKYNIKHKDLKKENCLSKIIDKECILYLIRLGVDYKENKITNISDEIIEYSRYVNKYRIILQRFIKKWIYKYKRYQWEII